MDEQRYWMGFSMAPYIGKGVEKGGQGKSNLQSTPSTGSKPSDTRSHCETDRPFRFRHEPEEGTSWPSLRFRGSSQAEATRSQGYSATGARDLVNQRDLSAANFVEHFSADWGDPSLYDLVINTGKIASAATADLIIKAMDCLRVPA